MSNTDPQTITVTLPAMDFAEEVARAERVMQAATLAGKLTPQQFASWMTYAAYVQQLNEEAPSTTTDQSEVQGA